ncbi:MAG: uncharacterized protein A8A55_1262 [Amphiamblys sp. WSBS2006]|nr:MAG: uncharacterized protein A8A55_1262 [Amphiamblys sp. WSBS2006]
MEEARFFFILAAEACVLFVWALVWARRKQGREGLLQYRESRECPEEACPVCLGGLLGGGKIVTLLCLHTFHRDCIVPWLRESQTCPTCRVVVCRRRRRKDKTYLVFL